MKNIPFIQKTSLFGKIASLVLLTLILAIGISTAVSIREQTKTITNELIDKNKAISKHLASSVKNAFWSLNWLFVEKQMQEIAKSEDVTFLELIKPNGEVYLSSGDTKLEENILPSVLLNLEKQILKDGLSLKTGGSIKLIITPIKIGSDKWALIIGLSLNEVEKAKKRILKNSLIWGSSIFLLGVFVSFLLARGLTKPIKRLAEGTKEIGKGNLDYRINIKSLDELGTLADSFNAMAEDLKKTTTSRDQLAIEINERKQAVEALRESEEKYRNLFNNAQVGMYRAIISDGKIVEANDAFARMFGYENRADILDAEYVASGNYVDPGTREILLEILREHGEFRNFEARLYRKDRSVAWFKYSGRIYPEKGYIEGVAADITEEKRLKKELLQAQKMKAVGALAGGVAHDLNNILSGIVSYPDLLLMDIPEDSPLRKPILTIQKSGQKAAVIVQDMLTLARRGVAITNVVNLNDIICDHLESPEHEKLKSFHPGVEIHINLAPDLLNILGSPVHISKTVMNLLSNAAEATPDAGTVTITTSNEYLDLPVRGYEEVLEGDYVVLSVVDSGIGISERDLAKIFEPFYTKKVMGRSGTGLGMAVVWGTVKDHKGYIDVISTEGKGSTFSLYFPVTRNEIVRKEEAIRIEEYMGKGETILVVDDIKEQREIASRILKKLGYSVATASSGEEAVDYMSDNSADLLVLDMIMDPGIDGLDTYREILALHPGQKAIIASGFSETARVKEAQKLGASKYIKKPYTLEKIGIAVKKELEK